METFARGGGRAGVLGAVLFWLFAGSTSCTNLAPGPAGLEPRAEALRGELAVVMSRLGTYPTRVVTRAEKIPVTFVFDPELVDVRKAERFSLWRFDPNGAGWERVATVPVGSGPYVLEPEEGLFGLAASVTFPDGAERLVPRPGDPPALWLCVDRTPPSVRWIQPHEGVSLKGLRAIELKWAANEIHFGSSHFLLQWSSDRGRTWKPIVTLPAQPGLGSYRWRIPPEVSSDVLVRVVARDLAGHETASAVALSYPGSVGEPLLAREESRGAVPREEPPVIADGLTAPPRAAAGEARVAPAVGGEGAGSVAPAATREPERTPDSPGARDAPRASEAPGPKEGRPASVRIDPVPGPHLRGGETVKVTWTWQGVAPSGTAKVEWSADGGANWSPIAEAPIAAGAVSWEVPRATASACSLRLRAAPEGQPPVEVETAEPFAIDSDPPRIALGDLPAAVGPELRIPVALSDPGGSGVHRIEAYLRPKASLAWIQLAEGRAELEGSDVRLDLEDFDEGEYELYVRAFDRVGNAAAPPSSDSAEEACEDAAARATVRLDRTPPSIRARRGAASWVAGFPAEAEVTVDWADAVPPLVAEGREPDGTWVELARFSTIRTGETRFSFRIPGRVRAYSVRFVAKDAAGNPAQAEIGPERVDTPIRLKSFLGEAVYPAGTLQRVSWELDPAAGSSAEPLLVRVEHGSGADSEWRKLCELAPEKQFLWELPAGGPEEHRLRVQLLRSGEVLGEDVSARFRIGGVEGPAPTAVAISEDSLFYSRRARETIGRYSELLSSGAAPQGSVEIENLRRSALSDLEKAIEVDPKNYQATYSLASFLNRLDPAANAAEVRKWLEKTVEVKPDHASAWNDLGASALLAGDYARAEEHLRKSLAVRKSAAGLYNLGLALYYGEKFSEAARAFRDALAAVGEGEVGEGEIYYYLACSHVREGQVGAARAIYREKADAIPEDLRAELSKMLPER